jgi:hypothetical protein
MPLRTAPSTLGLVQKSPQIANFMLLSQTHLSSPLIAMAGKALPHLWAFIKIGCGMFNPVA